MSESSSVKSAKKFDPSRTPATPEMIADMQARNPFSNSSTQSSLLFTAKPVRKFTINVPEMARIQARNMRDLFTFCQEIMGYKDMLRQSEEVIPDYSHEHLCKFLQADASPFKLILMPRYSFKSSITTVAYPIWRLLMDDDLRILIYSDTTSKAEAFLSEIKSHLTGHTFRSTFGKWEVDPKKGIWNQSAITIATRKLARKEPTIDTGGIETSKVGMHYDIILFDDIVSDKNITTPDQILKVKDCYRKALSLLSPGGKVILTGTRWHFGDLYGSILAEEDARTVTNTPKIFSTYIRQAELTVNNKQVYPFAAIKLTKEFLSRQRSEQGSFLYSSLYQQNPVDDETATFKSTQFRFFDPALLNQPAWWKPLYITCCVDPAISQDKDADDTAITVVGTDTDLNMYVLDIQAGHMLPDEMIERVFLIHKHWGIRHFGIETNAFQKILRRDLEYRYQKEIKENRDFRLFQITELTAASSKSKEMRIQGLQPYHERGAIRIPGQRIETLQGVWLKLAMQMLQFPRSSHDDVLDSLAWHTQVHRRADDRPEIKVIPENSPAWLERQEVDRVMKMDRRMPRWARRKIEYVFS